MDEWRRQRSHNLSVGTFNEKKASYYLYVLWCKQQFYNSLRSHLEAQLLCCMCLCRLCPFCLCSCTGGVLLVNAKWSSYFEKWNDCIWSNRAPSELLHPAHRTFLWIIITTSALPTPREEILPLAVLKVAGSREITSSVNLDESFSYNRHLLWNLQLKTLSPELLSM